MSAVGFRSIDEVKQKMEIADAIATANARANITSLLMTDPDVPVRTGFMRDQAVASLLSSGLTGDLDLLIWFNTFYAQYVQDRKRFIDKILPKIVQIMDNAIIKAYQSQGFQVTIT
jgi:hypothetical protein